MASSAAPSEVVQEFEKSLDLDIHSWTQGIREHIKSLPAEKVAKNTPHILQATAGMEHALVKFFHQTAHRLAAKVDGYEKMAKADDPSAEQLLKRLLPIDWYPLLEEIEPYMDEIAIQGGVQALKGLNIGSADIISYVNEAAADWASQRAAEMVGMKYVDGKLQENPDARWAISETTRDDITELVTNAFEARSSLPELSKQIQEAGTFSKSRARMIALTEGARAQTEGNKAGWKGSGVVESVEWLLSDDHDHDDICDELAEGGPYPLEDAPDCPAHPNCFCVLSPVLKDDTTGEEED